MRSRHPLLGLLLGLASFAWTITVLPPPADAQSPKRGGTLRVSYGNEIAHLDFYTAPGYELNWVAMNIGCGLLGITPDGKFVPDAAESWQISPDALLYTFKLRKDVMFHDGTRVDAAAVKFSIDRIIDPATRSSMRTYYEHVHSVEVLDPYTVQIRLKQPYGFMLHMLAAYRMGLVFYSPTATQKYTLEDRRSGKPEAVVGCGPFRLVEWVKGSHLVMDRFDKYWDHGFPYVDRVLIRVIKDPGTQMAAFKAGEAGLRGRHAAVPLRSGQGQGAACRGRLRTAEAPDLRADDEHREVRVPRHRHCHQGTGRSDRRDSEHPAGRQGDLDERGHAG